ncbi:putative ATP-dependent RNA helicase [archaeon GW2011_AR15]|nr:putative ATP-dependent RNA helicase [archaeon GW2011_AR15]
MKTFRELGIIEPVLKSIEEQGFQDPTEIQEKSIPVILSGKDVIAGSATGSGKTLAFASAVIKIVEPGQGIQAIILTPTRELAEQVSESMVLFSKYKRLRVASIYGGVSINPQMEKLHSAEVVVGTPGRVLDHMSRGTLDLSKIRIAVLDEADRMLDMGFIDDVNNILRECPADRQTLLYSATISSDIRGIAQRYMRDPVVLRVEAYVDPSKLEQFYYQVPVNMKFSLLAHLLKNETSGLVMVFCNTQRFTDVVARNLQKQGIQAMATHGGLSQSKRNHTMERFHEGKVGVLVCTDVAARGLHIEGVSHVYNYDIPKESKQYIHRIGRTARAGHEGKAISILTERDYENFDRVLRDTSINIQKVDVPRIDRIMIEAPQRREGRFFRKSGFRHGRR